MNSAVPASILPSDLHCLCKSSQPEILDLRTAPEHAAAHIPGVKLTPLHTLDAHAFLAQRQEPGAPIYLACHSGARATKAAEQFRKAGFDGCVLVAGGTQGWIDAGLPVERGTSHVLPLLRQVQIVVGLISGLGSALALGVDARFAIIPLLSGCGLLFAGLTGTCALALLLARMPWNNQAGPAATSCNSEPSR